MAAIELDQWAALPTISGVLSANPFDEALRVMMEAEAVAFHRAVQRALAEPTDGFSGYGISLAMFCEAYGLVGKHG